MPNFSRPISYQGSTTAAPDAFNQQSQSNPLRSSRVNRASKQEFDQTQTSANPYYQCALSPPAFDTIASPQIQGSSAWDASQTSPFEFSLDAAMSSEMNDSRVQPWWPPVVPSANAFLLQQQQQQQQQQRGSQQPQQRHQHHHSQSYMSSFNGANLSFDANDATTVGMSGLVLNTNFQSDPTSHPQQLQHPYNATMQVSSNPQMPSPRRRQRTSAPRHPARTPSPSSTTPVTTPRSARGGSRNSSASRSQSQHRRSKSASTAPRTPIAHHVSSASTSSAQAHGQRTSGQHHQRNHHRHHSASANLHGSHSTAARNPTPRMTRHHSSPSHPSTNPTVAGSSHIPSSSSSNQASVGFVNYTPSDSARILTGVAPSGSSKTKARREKEAADRRRRLSQAAARAVMEAGGDVAALEREGLWVG